MNIILEIISMIIGVILVNKLANELKNHTPPSDNIVSVYIEKIDNILYAWEDKTNRYLCQAQTHKDMALALTSLFPNKKIILQEKDNHGTQKN